MLTDTQVTVSADQTIDLLKNKLIQLMHQLRAQHFVLGTVQQKYGNTEKYFKIFSVLKSLKLVFLIALYFCGSMPSNLLGMSFLKMKAKDLF